MLRLLLAIGTRRAELASLAVQDVDRTDATATGTHSAPLSVGRVTRIDRHIADPVSPVGQAVAIVIDDDAIRHPTAPALAEAVVGVGGRRPSFPVASIGVCIGPPINLLAHT
jgi:hypothetical protein